MATNFFQRWSQRKLKTRDDGVELDQDVTVSSSDAVDPTLDAGIQPTQGHELDQSLNTQANDEQAPAGSETAETQSTHADLKLPDLTLADAAKVTFDSGVSTFMKEGVEKSVKKAALRKLFHSDEFNYVSDMDDHTEDFSNIPVLDTKVTQQLRQWVNQVAETAEDVIKASTSDASVASVESAQAPEGLIKDEEANTEGYVQEGHVEETAQEGDLQASIETTQTESNTISDSKFAHKDNSDLQKG